MEAQRQPRGRQGGPRLQLKGTSLHIWKFCQMILREQVENPRERDVCMQRHTSLFVPQSWCVPAMCLVWAKRVSGTASLAAWAAIQLAHSTVHGSPGGPAAMPGPHKSEELIKIQDRSVIRIFCLFPHLVHPS